MWLRLFTLYFVCHNIIVVSSEVGDICSPNGTQVNGECVEVYNCNAALRAIKENGNHKFRRCGFDGFNEIVCCPSGSNKPNTVPNRVFETTSTTTAPINKVGDTHRVADLECSKIISSYSPPLGLHIIGGEEVSMGEFPHMTALGYTLSGDSYEFKCGGSLVSVSYVLTAAHCVDTLDQIKPSIARMGVLDITGSSFNPETDERVANIILHPDYARNTKYHDLALLRLEKPISVNINQSPACLYTQDRDPKGTLTVTGWGKTSNDKDTRSSTLLKANVTVVNSAKCGESYTNWRKLPVGISKEQICAGDPAGLRDTCQGDSGGPLQGLTGTDGYYRIVGITSFGRGCGSPVPGVYTRVSHYLDWIESQVWPN